MNKTAIKNFSIRARVQLIEAVKQRAYYFGVSEEKEQTASGQRLTENSQQLTTADGALLTSTELEQRKSLVDRIRTVGYAQVMEEAAYTWFNRFIALRFNFVFEFLSVCFLKIIIFNGIGSF